MKESSIRARRRRSATAVLVLSALVATACGARLDPEVRDEAIEGLSNRGGQIVVAGAATTDTGTTTTTTTTTDTGTTTTTDTGTTTAQPGTSGPTTTSPGTTTGPTTTAQTGSSTPSGPDTRSAPAGGNGGATDVGIYEDRIVIGNAVDNSGAVPGIFIDAQYATQAFVAWFTATEGTIYGRRLELLTRDSRLDAGGNREAYLDFCENAFAAVGSMSAFDEGIIAPVSECGIPDIRSAVTNPDSMEVPSVFSADAISSKFFPANHYLYWNDKYPGAKDNAGMLYVDNDTTKRQTRLMISASSKLGYNYVVDRAIGLAETNYSTYVIELKEKGVTFLQFQGDAPQAVRLAKAMRQQNYWPDVFALQQNLYKPALYEQGGIDIAGAEIALGSVMNENIQFHPELQTYRQWLKQIRPEAEPTGQGAYSWSAGLLFVQLVKEIGPDLTREKLVEALRQVHDFEGNGLIPPQDVGNKIPSNCHIIVLVKENGFAPLDPPDGRTFNCRGQNQPG